MRTVIYKCSVCGTIPEKDEEKSNNNWLVMASKPCPKCGGRLVMDIVNIKKNNIGG